MHFHYKLNARFTCASRTIHQWIPRKGLKTAACETSRISATAARIGGDGSRNRRTEFSCQDVKAPQLSLLLNTPKVQQRTPALRCSPTSAPRKTAVNGETFQPNQFPDHLFSLAAEKAGTHCPALTPEPFSRS